jgi:hypothetical protein
VNPSNRVQISTALLCIGLHLFSFAIGPSALAATPKPARLQPVEKLPDPEAPAALGRPIVEPRYSCKRKIYYQKKLLTCDSYIRQDAEGLRPIVQEVPEALAHLDRYQKGRKTLRWMPYLGSSFVLVIIAGAITGSILAAQPVGSFEQKNYIPIRNTIVFAGLLGISATLAGGAIHLAVNERNLTRAVKTYNDARPADPIEIKVEAKVLF